MPNDREMLVAVVATIALGLCGLYVSLRRFFAGPRSPDPWDETVTAQIESPDSDRLCHRCVTPHSDLQPFFESRRDSVAKNWRDELWESHTLVAYGKVLTRKIEVGLVELVPPPMRTTISTPTALRHHGRTQPRWGCSIRRTLTQGSLSDSQPWALRQNPVGIPS
jgi:hypothetical protein